MVRFRMVDIIPLLPIERPRDNRSSFYFACPCCDDIKNGKDIRNGHLNINLVKDVFRCARCGFSGGVLDLYAYYSNCSRSDAKVAIASKLHIDERAVHTTKQKSQLAPVTTECDIAGIAERDAVYSALLGLLSLASDHRHNLLNRGLSEEAIDVNQYRTAPVVGYRTIAKRIMDNGCSLSGVPGFYRDDDGQWTISDIMRGILIPVKDIQGRIQGLQVRCDNMKKRKFRWVSSRERRDGCGAAGFTHLAGYPSKEMLIVEGPMKADIIHHLTGRTVLAIPGVNSLTQLQASLDLLKGCGLRRVMTAFDMDMLKNPHVQNSFNSLLWLLEGTGLKYGTYLWDPHYNGLDDYIWQQVMQMKHSYH